MTREEFVKEIVKRSKEDKSSPNNCIDLLVLYPVLKNFLNDLESRTCDNCKFHQNYNEESSGNIDSTNDKYCNMIGINTPSYFGCNRFEGLTDD